MAGRKPKSETNQPFSPKGAEFKVWLREFEHSLKGRTPAWSGFQTLLKLEEESAKKYKQPWAHDVRSQVLKSIHADTSPIPVDEAARANREHTKEVLKNLVAQLDSVLGHLRKTGKLVESEGGLRLNFSIDIEIFQKACNCARESLDLLETAGPESRRSDAVYQCIWFLVSIEGVIPEPQAFELAKLALMAHGYNESDLNDLRATSVRTGTVRRRKEVLRERFHNTLIQAARYGSRS